MGIPVVRPPAIRDREDLNQRDTRAAVKALDAPGVRRLTIGPLQLGATTVRVPHQLGRIPMGWQLIDKNAQADVWRDPTIATTADFIALKASATVTVTLQFW